MFKTDKQKRLKKPYRVEASLRVGRVVHLADRSVRFDHTVVALDDAVVTGLPLRFNVATVQIFYAIAEGVRWMCLKRVKQIFQFHDTLMHAKGK